MIFSIFILILICVDCQLLHHDLVLVVGDISFSSVRILVDFAAPLEHQQNERVFVKVIDPTKQSILQTLTLADELTSDSPYLLVLKNLPQKTNLKVSFQIQSKNVEEFVFFKTRSETEKFAPWFSFLSCNRISEDYDTFHWKTFSKLNATDVNVMFGDQIYADYIFKDYKEKLSSNITATALYDETLLKFRSLYRWVWSHPDVAPAFRRTSNWFLPDDHDITNNLGIDMWRNATLRPFIRAGKHAFIEYQVATQYEPVISLAERRECQACGGLDHCCTAMDRRLKLNRYKALGSTRVALVDLRFQRSFAKKHFLIGKDDRLEFERQISEWSEDANVKQIVVVTSIPLFFLTKFATFMVALIEQEYYSMHERYRKDTMKLLNFLVEMNEKKPIMLITGDFHHFHFSEICRDDNKCIHQILTSGMTRKSTSIVSHHLYWFYVYVRYLSLARVGNFVMTVEQMYLSHNFVRFQNLSNWALIGNNIPTTRDVLWQWIFDHFPVIFAMCVFCFVYLMMACVCSCGKRVVESKRKRQTKKQL